MNCELWTMNYKMDLHNSHIQKWGRMPKQLVSSLFLSETSGSVHLARWRIRWSLCYPVVRPEVGHPRRWPSSPASGWHRAGYWCQWSHPTKRPHHPEMPPILHLHCENDHVSESAEILLRMSLRRVWMCMCLCVSCMCVCVSIYTINTCMINCNTV